MNDNKISTVTAGCGSKIDSMIPTTSEEILVQRDHEADLNVTHTK